jgi:hypothetical protein
MLNFGSYQCCGFRELNGLHRHTDPVDAIKHFYRLVYGDPYVPNYYYQTHYYPAGTRWAICAFTQATVKAKYGTDFAAYITKHNLGEVTTLKKFYKNPNSRRMIKAWLWAVDHAAVKKHVEELKKVEAVNSKKEAQNG